MVKKEEKAGFVLDFMPERIKRAVIKISDGRRGGLSELREIRLRIHGRSTLLFGREKISLGTSPTASEFSEVIKRITDSSLYAHRDAIASGFVPLGRGVRVGVIGTARYEGGRMIGVSEISSLLFRIPGGYCSFSEELLGIFKSGVGSGMMIYSPPGGGKTTALRSLARGLGSGAFPLSVAVVDERREFFFEDYDMCEVDILSGYGKSRGIEIAVRTMSPDVVIIDEIGAEDSSGLTEVLRSGVPIVASVHASSFSELCKKPSVKPLIDMGAFNVFVGISSCLSGYELSVDRL